uniref:MFS domain-containing protein n=1 Tax=Steinernema glaseri TaxID=37863 RepID=A0A1I8AQM7_9BILA
MTADAPPKKPSFTFADKTRYAILVLSTLCLSIIQSNTLTLNFTIICMGPPSSQNGTLEEDLDASPYVYSPSQKSQLFSIVAVGALVAVYPTIWLIQLFGPRKVVSVYGLVSALSTALIPLSASWGFYYFLVMRFIQGSALSVCLNVIGYVTGHWSMLKTNALFIAFLSCFYQFGPIFTMPVSGLLCESSFGWPSVYYLHAIITVVLFVLFYYFYRDVPHMHRNVSEKELGKIQRGKEGMPQREPVPYKAILTSHAIWACWVAAIGNFMGVQLTMQYSPTYLNKVMGFPVEMTGLLAAIPQVFTFITKIVAGLISDKASCCSPEASVKIFNTIAVGGMGIFCFGLAFIPKSAPFLGLVFFYGACIILGFNCGAFFKSSQIIARYGSWGFTFTPSFPGSTTTSSWATTRSSTASPPYLSPSS